MIADWIDDLVEALCVTGDNGQPIKGYHVYDRAEVPDAISIFPSVLVFSEGVLPTYSFGGPALDAWIGIAEFHLYADTARSHYPSLMLYFPRIRNALAAAMSLHGKVEHLLPRADVPFPLRGPIRLQLGEEAPHLGIILQWQVKENVSDEIVTAS